MPPRPRQPRPMDLDAFRALFTPEGQRLLADLAARDVSDRTVLALSQSLRRQHSADLVAAAITQTRLRAHARTKFGADAVRMYFTPAGLEQATGGAVAALHAARYAAIGGEIADLCCGIGGDFRALAAAHDLLAVDRDPLTAAVAAANVAALDLTPRVTVRCDDATTVDLTRYAAAFLDPARRTDARRVFDVADYQPPWSFIAALAERIGNLGVKVAPGIPHDIIAPEAEAEWVSVAGDVKEAGLWFGALRSGVRRRATLLPSGATLTAATMTTAPPPVAPPRRYLYEPDGAVIRAHLVAEVATRIGGTLLDPTIAYITTDTAAPTPFARRYILTDALPFNLKHLRAYVREHGIGRVVVKKRGSPLDPDTLRRDLRLSGDGDERTLFLTRVAGVHTVLIGIPDRG